MVRTLLPSLVITFNSFSFDAYVGHLNNHFGYMPYVCDEEDCDYRSSYSFSIERHKKQAHGHPAQVVDERRQDQPSETS